MSVNYRWIGFLVSGLVHLGILLAVLLPGTGVVQSAPDERPLAIRLEMFQPAPSPEVPAEIPEPQATAPDVPPLAAEAPQPEPPAEPVERPEAMEVAQRPEREPQVQPEPAPPPAPAERPKDRLAHKPAQPRPPEVVPAPQLVSQVSTPPPQAVAPGPAAEPDPSLTEAVLAPVRERYLSALVAQIDHKKFYPRASRRLSEQGTVVVRFVIEKDGQLRDLQVADSSGIDRLDRAALDTLRKVTPFQPIPDALGRDQWPISVPIAFTLHR